MDCSIDQGNLVGVAILAFGASVLMGIMIYGLKEQYRKNQYQLKRLATLRLQRRL